MIDGSNEKKEKKEERKADGRADGGRPISRAADESGVEVDHHDPTVATHPLQHVGRHLGG